jgi:flavorubredoxin
MVATDEIADGIFRISTFDSRLGMSFNQFLIRDEQPLLFHTGHAHLFDAVRDAVDRLVPVSDLRWITYSHAEADECGSLNQFLAVAPDAQVAQGALGCSLWAGDQAVRPPRSLGDDEVLELGGHRVRHLDTPHVPHGWDARLLFEETTGTLFASDLFTHFGDGPAMTDGDVMGPAVEAERRFRSTSLTPATSTTILRLADLDVRTVAVMHGSSFAGDAPNVLEELARFYEDLLADVIAARTG